MTKEVYSISALKGISAILVVLIHTHLIGKQVFIPFYRTAVPIFFMISGYFLMDNNGKWHLEKIGGYLRKMVRIWIGTDMLYLCFLLFVFPEYNSVHNLSGLGKTIVCEIALGGQLCGPLWYITAYVWTLVILRTGKVGCNLYIIGALLLLNVLLGSYRFSVATGDKCPYIG